MKLAVVQFLNTLFLLKIVWGEWLVFFNEYHEVPWVREAPQLSAKMLLRLLVILSIIKDLECLFSNSTKLWQALLCGCCTIILCLMKTPRNESNISDCSVVRQRQKSSIRWRRPSKKWDVSTIYLVINLSILFRRISELYTYGTKCWSIVFVLVTVFMF